MRYVFIFVSLVFIATSTFAAQLTGFESPEGIKRLERSDAKVDFFPLANHFESQENKVYCGLASSAIVLNALRLDNPAITKPLDNTILSKQDRKYLPSGLNPVFERYTQNNLLGKETKSKEEILGKPMAVNGKKMADYGLQLRQLSSILTANGLDVVTRVADNSIDDEIIRKELIDNLKTPGDYVVVNFFRKTLGQGNIGHISPLGAYDKSSDSFLILDVNPNTSKWVWVNSSDLIAAMRTFDTIENRGYVLIKDVQAGK
jgi:hypothetical protein